MLLLPSDDDAAMTKPTGTPYDADLAHIHVEGYGFHWSGAAPALLTWLEEFGVPRGGTVVDLGCGGGQWLKRLAEEGYEGFGVDASAPMIRIAQEVAPGADFVCGSMAEVALPSCVAATSLGEPLNYLGSGAAMRRAMRKVDAALSPGGAFLFDVRHPAEKPVEVVHHHQKAKDWFCYARIEEDHKKGTLTRHITTFRLRADGAYHRNDEVHRLKVFPRAEVAEWLREIGFRVQIRRGHGDYALGARQSVFLCRKPEV